ncbi:MAG: hypothetical protein HON74_02815 [Flavobacteriaceae bacterium]|nr:hypothetical protein [Flavobacteriaceae bacterium]
MIKAVDYVSMHTYPMHNSYYNPEFWEVPVEEQMLPDFEKINKAMERAIKFAQSQFQSVSAYEKSIDSTKTVHIGESGWASASNGFYGRDYSNAADEYKAGEYYRRMRVAYDSIQLVILSKPVFSINSFSAVMVPPFRCPKSQCVQKNNQ